jgi:hypothetical protein
MSRSRQPEYEALSTLLHESGERRVSPVSEVRELRPRGGLDDRLAAIHAMKHPIEAAALCLRAVCHEETFRSSLFCVHDVDTAHSVVVYADGPEAERAILSRDAGDAEPSFTAGCMQKPFILRYSGSRPRVSRHRFMPALGEVLVAPVMSFGLCVGTFEILGRGSRFSEALARALGLAAGRFGEHLETLGVVLGFSVGEREGGYLLRPR